MKQNRREFLKTAALTAAGSSLLTQDPRASVPRRPLSRQEKLNIAIIGCGGRGHGDMQGVAHENIAALCDVDEERCARALQQHPGVPFYRDFRELLDKEKNLDAVVIATPDHVHAVAAVYAMERGLHVYCEKPLTHSVEEARVLRETAAKYNVVTQMGNQYTAHEGLRRAVELVRAGVIGEVREVHVWTNRPVWPQGMDRPGEILPIPSTLRWDLWLGPAAYRPYGDGYLPFDWRGWWDFGTGALGDMACHTLNMPNMALDLGTPTSVEAESSGINPDSAPSWSEIRFQFPSRGALPPVALTWYDGGKLPPLDLIPGVEMRAPRARRRRGQRGQQAQEAPAGVQLSASGAILVGDKGVMHAPGDYATRIELYPEERFENLDHVPQTLPRSENHHQEWLDGIRGGPVPMSNFDYAGPLTEVILLGNVALRSGEKISYDSANLTTGNPEADRFLRNEYRRGYSIHSKG